MEKSGVTIRPGDGSSEILLADAFNAAVPFVDRHLRQGQFAQACLGRQAVQVRVADRVAAKQHPFGRQRPREVHVQQISRGNLA